MAILKRTEEDDKYYENIEEGRQKSASKTIYLLQYHPIGRMVPTPVYNNLQYKSKPHTAAIYPTKGLAEEEYRRLVYLHPESTFYIYECKNVTDEFNGDNFS